jgi:very-short-patch-repair endonuclease
LSGQQLARNLRKQEPGQGNRHAKAAGAPNIPQTRVQRQHHETADDYERIVVRLCDRWRVIVCRDGIQWILQRRDAQRSGRARWTGSQYFTTRDALIRASRAKSGQVDPEALAILAALPERIGGAA